MSSIAKSCPVVTRDTVRGLEVLAFRHPLAGKQLVKGTIEPNESPEQAALRELAEESGIADVTKILDLGKSTRIADGQVWHFIHCKTPVLPDHWTFHTSDDGGHLFDFFWHRLNKEPDAGWHETFRHALNFIKIALQH